VNEAAGSSEIKKEDFLIKKARVDDDDEEEEERDNAPSRESNYDSAANLINRPSVHPLEVEMEE